MTENNIVYQARLHWVLFFWPLCVLIMALFLGFRYEPLFQPSLYVAIISLVWLFVAWLIYEFSSLTLKKNQIVLRTGLFVRQTVDIPLNKIESIDIRQSILGSLLRYGSLVITGTGGSRQMVHYLNQPLTCRRYIEQLMHG